MDNKLIADEIVKNIGGKENIIHVFHCVTRLRFTLKDLSLVDSQALNDTDGVMGTNLAGEQFQVIVGNRVSKVFSELQPGNASDPSAGEPITDDSTIVKKKKSSKHWVSAILEVISGIFSPILPAIAGCGVLKGFLALFTSFHWVETTNPTYQIFFAISDGAFYFLPMLIAFSAGIKFKANPYISVALAAVLFQPTIVSTFKAGTALSFFDIPVLPVTYANSVIPIIFSVWMLSYIEKLLNKIIPTLLANIFVPLCSLLIAAPIMLMAIGPAGILAGNGLSDGIVWLVDNLGPVAGIILGGTLSLMVITGMHYMLGPIMMNNIATYGHDPIKILSFVANFGQAGGAFGVFIRSRNKKTKSLALSTSFSALMGITEPAIYGINLRFKKPFVAGLIGSAVGGCLGLTMGVKAYAYAMSGLPTLPTLAGPTFGWALLSIALAFTVAATITVVIGFDEDGTGKETEKENKSGKKTTPTVTEVTSTESQLSAQNKQGIQPPIAAKMDVVLSAPISGEIIPLSEVSDPVFADEMFGKGVAIIPENGFLRSPVNGKIDSIFPTNHAVTLVSDDGTEILIHIGINTVSLNGLHFKREAQEGQEVKIGDPIIFFELEQLKDKGFDTSVIIIVMNAEKYTDVICTTHQKIATSSPFLKLSLA